MSSYEERFAIRQVAINATTWVDIQGVAVLPISCNFAIVYNSSSVDIYLRSDPTNANTQITIPAGGQFEIGSPTFSNLGYRFPTGCNALAALLSSSGNQTVAVEAIQ